MSSGGQYDRCWEIEEESLNDGETNRVEAEYIECKKVHYCYEHRGKLLGSKGDRIEDHDRRVRECVREEDYRQMSTNKEHLSMLV